MTLPYLSIVIPSRNDDHAGGILRRLQACVHGLLEQARRHPLKMELILVDWNPPPDRRPLAEEFHWAPAGVATVRAITVPPSLHLRFPFGNLKPLHPMAGWNTGLRRARGRFILCTTSDVLLSDELVACLAEEKLQERAFYRIDRQDVDRSVLEIADFGKQLDFCSGHVLRTDGWTPHEFPSKYGIPHLHLGCPGDFMLMSAEAWGQLGGFPEFDIGGPAVDLLQCYRAHLLGLQEVVFRHPLRLYHINHTDYWRNEKHPLERLFYDRMKAKKILPRWIRRWMAPAFLAVFPRKQSRWQSLGIPSLSYSDLEDLVIAMYSGKRPLEFNDERWGFAGEDLPEKGIL